MHMILGVVLFRTFCLKYLTMHFFVPRASTLEKCAGKTYKMHACKQPFLELKHEKIIYSAWKMLANFFVVCNI